MIDLYLSRDLFYLAFCCLGFGAGALVSLFASDLTLKQRNRKITCAILWFSGALISLTLAIVFSKGEVFLHKDFYIAGSVFFVLTAASFRFPKYAGFPLIIIAGFLVTVFAFLFLRFPLADETDPLVFRTDESKQAAVRIMRSSDTESLSEFAYFELSNLEDPLSVIVYEFHIDEAVPLAGGQVRSSPFEIIQNGALIFSNPMISRIPFLHFLKDENRKFVVNIQSYQRHMFVEAL